MNSLFTHLSSPRIATLIRTAKKRVCYAAPGIQTVTAQAVAELAKRLPADELTVSLDFNESSLRMGYGSLSPQPVNVGAILVLPGWFIDRRARSAVTVLSGSEVASNVPKLNGTATSENEIRRLAAIIEDRNRNIEY